MNNTAPKPGAHVLVLSMVVCHNENLLPKFNNTTGMVSGVKESGSTLERGAERTDYFMGH